MNGAGRREKEQSLQAPARRREARAARFIAQHLCALQKPRIMLIICIEDRCP